MKKIKNALLTIGLALFNGLSLINTVSAANAAESERFYCPEQITCSQRGHIQSCEPQGLNLQYWDKMQEDGKIEAGVYLFQQAGSTYEAPSSSPDESYCRYYYRTESGNLKSIALHVKQGANIEAYVDKTTRWAMLGYTTECFPGYPRLSCPFTRTSAIGINNLSARNSFTIYSNEIKLIDDPIYSTQFTKIAYDQVLLACATNKECTLDIIAQSVDGEAQPIGNAVVDMTNKMQILKINSTDSDFSIEQIEGLNSIKIVDVTRQ